MKLRQLAHLAEAIASVAVVATLVVLIVEVRANTVALESQATLERTRALAEPYLEDLPSILAKIKETDGPDVLPAAFMERYDLTYEEATTWERHLWLLWSTYEAEFVLRGQNDELSHIIGILKGTDDNQLYLEFGLGRHSEEFAEYVERVPTEVPAR